MTEQNTKDQRIYCRVSASLNFRLDTVAAATGQAKSDIIREAVEQKIIELEKKLAKIKK